VVETEGGGMFL